MKYTQQEEEQIARIQHERGISRKSAAQRMRREQNKQQTTAPASSSAQTAAPVTAA